MWSTHEQLASKPTCSRRNRMDCMIFMIQNNEGNHFLYDVEIRGDPLQLLFALKQQKTEVS